MPAPPATDSEFLRRAWLDLCGVIPPVNGDDGLTSARAFLRNTDSDKREKLLERLLASPSHATHFANLWKDALLPRDALARQSGRDANFLRWLREHFSANTPYDQVVRELLLASGQANRTPPVLFYTALQAKPEELAANTMMAPENMKRDLTIGTAQEVIDQIKRYEDLGYDEFSFWIDSGMSSERKRASLDRFLNDVMPKFS